MDNDSLRMRRSILLFGSVLLCAACTGAPTKNGAAPSASGSWASVARSASGSTVAADSFVFPIADAGKRVTKKSFGIHVSPKSSPVQPERFTGYHTGTDFETLPQEKDSDVPITAVCSGRVLFAQWVKGYGGVLVQRCTLKGQPITVLYGHLKSYALAVTRGDTLTAGERIGLLGQGASTETDGERKHLHLAIHRGEDLDLRGYALSKKTLEEWMDPMTVILLK